MIMATAMPGRPAFIVALTSQASSSCSCLIETSENPPETGLSRAA